jgi:bifunctional DNA-binding transcriptional regulator/antitoxin component of YhaV-PrlF toxin-antitoxin module
MEEFKANIDETGRLVLPPELIIQFGLNPGTRIRIGKNANGLHLRRPPTHLAKVYIEAFSTVCAPSLLPRMSFSAARGNLWHIPALRI